MLQLKKQFTESSGVTGTRHIKGGGVWTVLVVLFFVWPCCVRAELLPGQLVVVANGKVPESVALAKYYMEKRKVPSQNLITLSVTADEHMSRADYEKNAVPPVRQFIKKREASGSPVRCIVVMYGVPLVVAQPDFTAKEKAEIDRRTTMLSRLSARKKITIGKKRRGFYERVMEKIRQDIARYNKSDQVASFDSEIALVLEDAYPLSGWVPNPDFLGYRGKSVPGIAQRALIVSRLDGPDRQTVMRIINDSLYAESAGLRGKAYFDARWKMSSSDNLSGYAYYDVSIHLAANAVRQSGKMPVVLDESERLFGPGECKQAALYCGWYSLGRYIPAFTWVRGAVGYHIASVECSTLKKKESKVWCKAMLENGVAATIGPVGEPYVQAFAIPELFFKALLQGNLTLGECYAISNPFLSWKMVLIGDPLYRPFLASGGHAVP